MLIMPVDGFFAAARIVLPWCFVLMAIMYGLSDDGSADARILASLFCLTAAGGCLVI